MLDSRRKLIDALTEFCRDKEGDPKELEHASILQTKLVFHTPPDIPPGD